MAAWRYRVTKDDSGKLHFVFARYDEMDKYERRGLIAGIVNEGNSIDEMRTLARMLLLACDEPVISMAEYEDEPHDDEEEDDYWPTEADIEQMEEDAAIEASIEAQEWRCVLCGDDLRECGHDQNIGDEICP